MNNNLNGIVCVDVGGTYIKSGFLQNDELWDLQETATPIKGGNEIVKAIIQIAKKYDTAKAIGISTAGEVNPKDGSISYAVNIPQYTGLQLKKLVQLETGLTTIVENDVNAAAIGELYFGAGKEKDLSSFVMASYGTGIGGAIVIDKQIFRGCTGSAGEIGGLITHQETAIGEEGSGSYERYASTTALVQRASRLSPNLNSGRAIFEAMEDKTVAMVVNRWIDEVSYGLVGAIHLLNPQAVVLGGGIMEQEQILVSLHNKIQMMLKPTFANTEIISAKLGNKASLFGAGSLAEQALL